jgi:hypothetical protein
MRFYSKLAPNTSAIILGGVFAKFISIAVVFLLLGLSSGCSVGLALQETEEPNLDILEIGSMRSDIEKELGLPISEGISASGDKLYLYRYLEGDRAAYGRATLYVFLDVVTLGLWEIFGSNIESANGVYVDLAISYDSDERAGQIRRVTPGVDSFGDRLR